MIYQCYHAPGQEQRLFASPLYRGFGLEPEVNPHIARRCPELREAGARRALTEYGAMLHLWRNDCADPWIGFSSYRQLDKFPTVFEPCDLPRIERALREAGGVGWGFYRPHNTTAGRPGSLAEVGETCHPGLTACLAALLARFGHRLPEAYLTEDVGPFASYWILPRSDFAHFMEWSFPLVRWCLERRQADPFLASCDKSVGYLAERLFILWLQAGGRRLANLGCVDLLPFRENGAVARIAALGRLAG